MTQRYGAGRPEPVGPPVLDGLLAAVARGDQAAFARLYDHCAGQVYGIVRRVLRDPAQSEEVAQEVLVEVWRTAPRYDAARGSATGWILTIAHRRAVDRVRSEQASRAREVRSGRQDRAPTTRSRRRSSSAWSTSRSAGR